MNWKPISETPPEDTELLVFVVNEIHDSANIKIAEHTRQGWLDAAYAPVEIFSYKVTHWSPLPNAPRRED